MNPSDINIDEEFQALIPPLTKEEFLALEKSILLEGVRDPLILWHNTLIDGHNRFDILTKHGIQTFQTVAKRFNNKNEAKVWIIDNQLARRNLTDYSKYQLANIKRELLKEKGRENLKIPTGGKQGLTLSKMDKVVEQHDTREELAKDLGWSPAKLGRMDVVMKRASPEQKEKLQKGEETIHKVYSELKKQDRLEKVQEQRKAIEEGKVKLPEGKYEVIVIDPPWPYQGDSQAYNAEGNRGTIPYPELSMEKLKKLNLPSADDCILWLWTTNSFMKEAYELLDVWGFQPKTILTWDKQLLGTGRWLRNITEHCILAVKGEPRRKSIFTNTTWTTLISEQRTTHSTKPGVFYDLVNKTCVGRKLDYFARKERDGWDSHGDEVF